MEQGKLNRINELYKKQKESGLTDEEVIEQARLRKEYVSLVTKNFKGTLSTIKVQDLDGNVKPLKRKK
ncbi:MAG: DUF896 family protein [Firmicutes bacterium HGW-Firmicutes-7]|nr:MAG: DUF896 family protein [Firmicutes bacterium HGW-Firmicutes-7]